jgi:hypothetical protein
VLDEFNRIKIGPIGVGCARRVLKVGVHPEISVRMGPGSVPVWVTLTDMITFQFNFHPPRVFLRLSQLPEIFRFGKEGRKRVAHV